MEGLDQLVQATFKELILGGTLTSSINREAFDIYVASVVKQANPEATDELVSEYQESIWNSFQESLNTFKNPGSMAPGTDSVFILDARASMNTTSTPLLIDESSDLLSMMTVENAVENSGKLDSCLFRVFQSTEKSLFSSGDMRTQVSVLTKLLSWKVYLLSRTLNVHDSIAHVDRLLNFHSQTLPEKCSGVYLQVSVLYNLLDTGILNSAAILEYLPTLSPRVESILSVLKTMSLVKLCLLRTPCSDITSITNNSQSVHLPQELRQWLSTDCEYISMGQALASIGNWSLKRLTQKHDLVLCMDGTQVGSNASVSLDYVGEDTSGDQECSSKDADLIGEILASSGLLNH